MGFFSKKTNPEKAKCPVSEEIRIWMEDSYLWLMTQFGQQTILNNRILTPDYSSFAFSFTTDKEDAFKSLTTLCSQMKIEPSDIELYFYTDHIIEYNNEPGFQLSSIQDENESTTAGLYFNKNENGKFIIAIEEEQLKDSTNLVATIAHELAHIKILGEGRLNINDEYLTDLVTVFFGLGIFTANSSFRFYSNQGGWGYSRQGYLFQQEWGYALALYAYIREERSPSWINFLAPNIKSDFLQGEKYIYAHEDIILR